MLIYGHELLLWLKERDRKNKKQRQVSVKGCTKDTVRSRTIQENLRTEPLLYMKGGTSWWMPPGCGVLCLSDWGTLQGRCGTSHSLLGDISVSPSQKPLVSSATLTWINRWKCTDGVFLAAVMVKHLNTQVFSQFKACMYVCTDVQIWLINHLADWWLQWCWAVGQMPPQFRCWWVSRWQVETWMRVSEHPG